MDYSVKMQLLTLMQLFQTARKFQVQMWISFFMLCKHGLTSLSQLSMNYMNVSMNTAIF